MAHKYKLDFDGQSVVQTDYNGLAAEASTGEDHVYAELFRLTPGVGSIARGVIPYGTTGTIVANGASGSVLVNPFRAVIGTRTAAATDAVANWQDVRSALSIADGATALTTLVTFGANASGNPRWDAVYAAVTVDASSTPTTRKVKNPGTAVVTNESVSVYSRTAVTVGSVAGTPAATPTFPAVPADAGDVYYVLLGYVRIPNGFTAGSTVSNKDINESCAILGLSSSTGAASLRPANQSNIDGGLGISGAGTSSNAGASGEMKWTGTTAKRPAMYMPPSMIGAESIILTIDLGNASSANWSHQSLAVLDNSRDWRRRICRWFASIGADTLGNAQTPWAGATAGHILSTAEDGAGAGASLTTTAPMPGYGLASFRSATASGLGSTFGNTRNTGNSDFAAALYAVGAAASATPGAGANVPTNIMAPGGFVGVYADQTTGELKLVVSATAPRVVVFFWLDFTAQYPNL